MSLPQLTPALLTSNKELLPDYERISQLPEKVIQFGTGVLLRGLPDYFIDKANRQGVFNGRIVVVKSTDSGGVDAFNQQQSLFTHALRGIQDGEVVNETIINSSISRTLSASNQWHEILQVAAREDLEVIISNTTEVGIQLVPDNVHASPPVSFPGKLTALLYRRFQTFGNTPEKGLVIVPTELLPDNGKILKDIVLEQAHRSHLGANFLNWVERHNHFCSSLVDRIVPGKPAEEVREDIFRQQGYTDDLTIMSEPYSLWAIQGGDRVKSILSFAQTDKGVVIEPNIDIYRELKLRLLNGTHTLIVGLSYLYGKDTVRESMEDPALETFTSKLMLEELGPAIPYPVEKSQYEPFGNQVLDRFRNPSIRHLLLDITVQYTAKMKMRNIPTLLEHYSNSQEVPERFASGFAAFLVFMKAVEEKDGLFYGARNGQPYQIRCDSARYFWEKWKQADGKADQLVDSVLSDTALWGHDLTQLAGFRDRVASNVQTILSSGASALLS
jgi:tagaturonate reductase